MKTNNTLTIRYIGTDDNRQFLIQRGDHKFWTGSDWHKSFDKAKPFTDHKAAQLTCAAIQRRQYAGKPQRTFKIELSITLVADDVHKIDQKDLERYISKAMRIDMETAIYGDGPVADSLVKARVHLATLEETVPEKDTF